MLASVRRPGNLKFGIDGGAFRNRAREFVANPLTILFMNQTEEVLVAPIECTWRQPEKNMHPLIPPNHTSWQIPIPGPHSCRTQCQILSIQLAVATRVAHEG